MNMFCDEKEGCRCKSVSACQISHSEPPDIYSYVKARAGRSQIIAAVINNINNS